MTIAATASSANVSSANVSRTQSVRPSTIVNHIALSADIMQFRHQLGIMIVDHGSRRGASNEALLQVVVAFRAESPFTLVEPAHMELAEPSIRTAFARLVEQGAQSVIAHPFFLLPGAHWHEDIPRLVAEAAREFPMVRYLVSAPLANHRLMATIMHERIEHCWLHAQRRTPACEVCGDESRCLWRAASDTSSPSDNAGVDSISDETT